VLLWLQNKGQYRFYSAAFAAVGVVTAVIAACYIPFYTSIATVTTPFTFHFSQNPSKCIGEVLSCAIYYIPQLLVGHTQSLQNTVYHSTGSMAQVLMAVSIVKVCQLFALCSSLYIVIRFLRDQQILNQWLRVYVRALLLFLLFYMHIFNPWYLMMILPFMWVTESTAFMRWIFILTCFISVQDLVCIITRDTMVYAAELGLTFISITFYLYRPGYMFFTSLGYRWRLARVWQ
jgi:hypothetical protein